MISISEAQDLIVKHATSLSAESVHLDKAYNRVLAEDISADRNYPPFNRAAMDGFAFKSDDILQKKIIGFKIVGELFAGYDFKGNVNSGECIRIMTGSSVPSGLDCIVQVELAEEKDSVVKFKSYDVRAWQHISREGEDCKTSDIILNRGILLSPTEIAILAVLGKKEVLVTKSPRVAILSTGDELVPVGEPISPFQIRDSNAYALLAFFQQMGIEVSKREIVKDDPTTLRESLQQVIDFDIVILSGGVSMGAADYVPAALLSLGINKVFHKIKLKPGKPLWFGKSDTGTAFFGLPGNPLSCQVCFKLFIETYIKASQGIKIVSHCKMPLLSSKKKKVQLDEYFPVKLTSEGLEIISFNGSGDVTSTASSTGIALHAFDSEDLKQGDLIQYIPWRNA